VARADWSGLTVKLDKGTPAVSLNAFGWRKVRMRERDERSDLPHGLDPSQGRLVCTHWSQDCFEVVAREAEEAPLRREFAAADGGFSFAWHLFTCRERRSLEEE
jgi:hypothetical protein